MRQKLLSDTICIWQELIIRRIHTCDFTGLVRPFSCTGKQAYNLLRCNHVQKINRGVYYMGTVA